MAAGKHAPTDVERELEVLELASSIALARAHDLEQDHPHRALGAAWAAAILFIRAAVLRRQVPPA